MITEEKAIIDYNKHKKESSKKTLLLDSRLAVGGQLARGLTT